MLYRCHSSIQILTALIQTLWAQSYGFARGSTGPIRTNDFAHSEVRISATQNRVLDIKVNSWAAWAVRVKNWRVLSSDSGQSSFGL